MTDRLALVRDWGVGGVEKKEERCRGRDKREQLGGRMKTILSNLRAVKSLSAGRGPKAH